ncbi:MAG: GatB/YqeY domain-containing protein [Deltaproteobacteria bacterium]|nr:GatB/YqeY domain-containing protein [Deltaproteobacteria bacterium]
MSLNEKIAQDLKTAMKARDAIRLSALRMLRSAMKNLQVEKGRELTDEEIHSVIGSMVRKGNEAAEEFRRGGREDLALKEEKEVEIFYAYLPQQLTPEAIETTLRDIIKDLSAQGPKDMGRVMKAAMAKMAGQVQGKTVSEIAKRILSA